ncbi:hypothetical protein COU53_00785 [Candidatus Pacearchaeota archaeon CG10_big_fil_rev_8_21_14_0_10_30_48]|nr:MAG: hypothetical protein COU53_00785 [Candidatus Pacearchaeota archaeon CG10_big_fil_rev_8_21_14_0_10_30_48]
MALTPIETIALIFAVIGIVKLLVIIIDRRSWFPIIRGIYGNPKISSVIVFVLVLIVFYYLIKEITMVQLMATIGFVSLLIALAFLQWNKEVLTLSKKILKDKLSLGTLIYLLLWLVLMLWTIYEIVV